MTEIEPQYNNIDMEKEREIIFIRHGRSEGNDNPLKYQEGDPNVNLTDEGKRQLIRTGMGLAEYLQERGYTKPPLFVHGEFNRHIQSFEHLQFGMGEQFCPRAQKPHHDTRLNEISFGAIPYMIGKEDQYYEGISLEYSKAVKDGNDFSAAALHGESSRMAHALMKTFLDGTVERDFDDGHDCIVCVTSGRPVQVALMNLMHIPMHALEDGSLKNPDNGDMVSVKGTKENYTATRIWHGPTASARNDNIMDEVTPLPKFGVADHIKNDPEFAHLRNDDVNEIPEP